MEVKKLTSNHLARSLTDGKVGVMMDKDFEDDAIFWDFRPYGEEFPELQQHVLTGGPRFLVPVFKFSEEMQGWFENLFPNYNKIHIIEGDCEGYVGYFKLRSKH